jgi:hypothetical protein
VEFEGFIDQILDSDIDADTGASLDVLIEGILD